jgi:hypothetical protein
MCTDSLKIEAIQVEYNTSSDVAQPSRHPPKYRHHVETSVQSALAAPHAFQTIYAPITGQNGNQFRLIQPE